VRTPSTILCDGMSPYHMLEANEQGVVAHWHRLNRLMTWSDHRASVEEIRVHPLFDVVEWSSLRMMPAPRPPTLKSIMDTSYFPTEEYADIPEVPAGWMQTRTLRSSGKPLFTVATIVADCWSGFTFKRFTGV